MQILTKMLAEMKRRQGSDMYVSVGAAPCVKVHGELQPVIEQNLTREQALALVRETMSEEQFRRYESDKEANFAVNVDGVGRFRVSAMWQQGLPAMVIRRIETEIPTFEALRLPEILREGCMAKRGLVLFVGATGAGKSSTQAAMVGYRNQNSSGHILTIEDPVEFVHQHGRSIVTQREVGTDTPSFDTALKNSLRQAPDVILIGEIRSQETMEFALAFAETGHLCMATLHANNANQALDRIMNLVPEEKHRQLLFDLAMNLKMIVAQQLIPNSDGSGRSGVFEILVNTPLVSDLIRRHELHKLKEVMAKSNEQGMQTFDQALFSLYQAGKISYTQALHHADSANDLRLMIKLSSDDKLVGGMADNLTVDLD